MRAACNAIVVVMTLALVGACQIELEELPAFGSPCSDSCPDGYFCDKDIGACVFGEAPEPPPPPPPPPDPKHAKIDSFTVDVEDVRPDQAMTFTWTTTDALSCAIEDLALADLEPNDFVTVTLSEPGDYTIEIECVGEDEEPETDDVTVHVRKVAQDLVLATPEDVIAHSDVEEVDGFLEITGTVLDASLLTLTVVHGDLRARDLDVMQVLSLPTIARVDGAVEIRAGLTLERAELTALASIGGNLLVAKEPLIAIDTAFTDLAAPVLASVGGDVAISAYEIPDENDDGLADSTDFGVSTLESLAVIDLGALETVGGSFRIEEALALSTVSLPVIQSIGGTFALFNLDSVTELEVPVVSIGGGIVLEGNDFLASVRFPLLTTTGAVRDLVGDAYEKSHDEFLPSCAVDSFEPGDIFFLGNAVDADVCSPFGEGDNDAIEEIAFPLLETMGGRLQIVGTGIGVNNIPPVQGFPSLVSAGGIVIHRNGSFGGDFDFPVLETVGAKGLVLDGGDNITGMGALVSVEGDIVLDAASLPTFPSLTTIGGSLSLNTLNNAEVNGLNALVDVGQLSLTGGSVSTINWPALQSVGSMTLSAPSLSTLTLPSLTSANVINVTSSNLANLNMCSLIIVSTSLTVRNSDLTSLNMFASLTSAPTVVFTSNATLPACYVDALGAQAGATTVTNTTNNTANVPDPCVIDADAICGG